MATKPLKRAVQIVGSQSALARAIGDGVKQQNVWYWLENDVVPAKRCVAIERATGGLVTRHDLRPDIFGAAPQPSAMED